MRKNIFKALSAAVALSFMLTGCSAGIFENIGSSDGEESWWTGFSEDDFPFAGGSSSGSPADTTVAASTSAPDEPATEHQRSDFTDGGTIMSTENGELDIVRLTREAEQEMGGGDWTVLVYLCGSDLESVGNSATADLVEMVETDLGDGVNIVIQTGGASSWYENIISADKTQRYIVQNNDIHLVDEFSRTNMGDPDTLSDFVKWSAENYPADNMGLILWNHGSGSINGVCFDENYGGDSLTLKELDKALGDSFDSMTERFEFVGFDACLMATLETANVLVPYAKYMYASEELEPGFGWYYTAIADYLTKHPGADGDELGREIADTYYDYCREYGLESTSTFSVTDLSKIDSVILSFNNTAKEMYESSKYSTIIKAIRGADNFGGNSRSEGYSNMVDLRDMLYAISEYCPNATETVMYLDAAVSYKVNGHSHREAGGLSVYYPLAVQGSEELSAFTDICPSAYYLAFVDKAAYGTTGYDPFGYDNTDIVGDWDDIWDIEYNYGDYTTNTDNFFNEATGGTLNVSDTYFSGGGVYTLRINSFDYLDYAACSVFIVDEENSAGIYLGTDDYVDYDFDNNLIMDCFNGTWICLDDGQQLSIECIEQTADYSVYTCPVLLNGESTNLRIEYDWNEKVWHVIGSWGGVDEETGMVARECEPLEYGDVIQPLYCGFVNDEYYDIEGGKYVVTDTINLTYQDLPAGDYYYCMTLYDIYGNWYQTELVTFTIEEDGTISFDPDELPNGPDGGTGTTGGYDEPVTATELSYGLFDYDNLLSDAEEEEINVRLKELAETINCSIVIVSTNDVGGKTTEQYANDFSDTYLSEVDHILLVVDNYNEFDFIVYSGVGSTYLKGKTDSVFDEFQGSLASYGLYYAIFAYCDEIERLALESSYY